MDPAPHDPAGPATGDGRVLRGGSWYDSPVNCRAACRSWGAPASRYYSFGLRLCFRLD
jgi:formylglycine-generating enzyme required for sulfatase activity